MLKIDLETLQKASLNDLKQLLLEVVVDGVDIEAVTTKKMAIQLLKSGSIIPIDS